MKFDGSPTQSIMMEQPQATPNISPWKKNDKSTEII